MEMGSSMKKIVKVILIVSTLMAVALAVAMVYLNQLKTKQNTENQQEAKKELDILLDDMEKLSFTEDDEIIPLYLTGKKKNVLTFPKASLSDIYTVAHTKKIDKELRVEKKRGSRRVDNAVWAWNPYGTQPMSLYVYFPTRQAAYVNYTISVDDDEIPDFTRTLNNHTGRNLTQTQEYSIIGLIPGKKNYITLRVYNEEEKKQNEVIYSIDVPNVSKDIEKQISMTKGYNQELLASGLYVIYGNNIENKDKSYLLFYDNSGYLRSYIPLKSFHAQNIQTFDGCLFFPCSKTEFALMSPIGQIRKMYSLEDYELYGGFDYDGTSNIYALADKKGQTETVHDKIIQLKLKTGEIVKTIDMGDYLTKAKTKAKRNVTGKRKKKTSAKKLNWLDLNSIQCMDGSTLILSSRELSGIIVLKRVNKSKPVLKSIIGETIFWHNTGLNKKVAEKSGSFTAQFGQNHVTFGKSGTYQDLSPEFDENGNVIQSEEAVAAKQYYLYMFNNNYGDSKTVPSINYNSYGVGTKKKRAAHSYFYQYLFDETENLYKLIKTMELPFSTNYGSVQIYEDNIIAGSSEQKVFMEYTPDGKMLHTYNPKFIFSKVEKHDMKNFWFW